MVCLRTAGTGLPDVYRRVCRVHRWWCQGSPGDAVDKVFRQTVQKPDSSKATVSQKKPTSKTSTKKTKVAAYEPPEWVKAIKNYSNNGQSEEQPLQEKSTFANKYLMANPPKSRRRPGPSLNRFKEMVNTMKISIR